MLLELKNVKKYFPVRKGAVFSRQRYIRAVDDVTLSIAAGQNLSLVGESGCGKTTLGRLIMRMLPLDEGRMFFDGQQIDTLSSRGMRRYRKDMQLVFQDPFNSLDPRFTVRNIIAEAMLFDRQHKKSRERQQRITEMLRAVHLPDDTILNRFPHEFSGGERQRIAIARALVMNPKLVILDEAVSSLDILVQNQIIDLLLDIQRQFHVTYLFISHNLRTVKKLSQQIAVMYQGKIVEMGPAQEIFDNPLHPYTQQLLSAALHYRVAGNPGGIVMKEGACLVDRGNGHFVMS